MQMILHKFGYILTKPVQRLPSTMFIITPTFELTKDFVLFVLDTSIVEAQTSFTFLPVYLRDVRALAILDHYAMELNRVSSFWT